MRLLLWNGFAVVFFCASMLPSDADSDVAILDVPDYRWYAGCFGTACGNLMGYWDRNGLPDFYTGPTGDGVAPLSDRTGNEGIRSMWASKAGVDERPADQPGHIDDYWAVYASDSSFSYESTAPDPYVTAGRAEHSPDCIGDFIGLSQRKWTNMNGECDGNIDAYSYVYWDPTGQKRVNFIPSEEAGSPARDIQSGLREWTRYRGYDADVFTQLTDFNPEAPAGSGFTFEDLKAEIDAGYPVMVFLQNFNDPSRALSGMPRANPVIHGMVIYRYVESSEFGVYRAHYRTSWGYSNYAQWYSGVWEANLPVRGVIGFRPKPRLRSIRQDAGDLTLEWDGPSSLVYDALADTTNRVHRYEVERTTDLTGNVWERVGSVTTDRTMTLSACCGGSAFFRVRLLGPNEPSEAE